MILYGIKKICDLPGDHQEFWKRTYDNTLIVTDDLAAATELVHYFEAQPGGPEYRYEAQVVPLSELPDHWLLVLIAEGIQELTKTLTGPRETK